MYQVIVIYGPDEPWWFFDDWQETIKEEFQFEELSAAKAIFFELEHKLALTNEKSNEKTKDSFLIAFWNEGDMEFCEECDEELQQYTGLMLLHNCRPLDDSNQELTEKIFSCRIHE